MSVVKAINFREPVANKFVPLPIQRWEAAMRFDEAKGAESLRKAYRENWPTQGELIMAGACEFQCQHCIYPPSYARLNHELAADWWNRILHDMYENLGIRTFVYGGRSVTREGLRVLLRLRERHSDVHIGLIDNGISMLRDHGRLQGIKPDWIDISLDGCESDHDRQRGRNGSYRAGLSGACWLVDNGIAPKVNILTCLTTINHCSVIPMVRELNQEGFKNFFITPVTIVDGARPSPHLRLNAREFIEFFEELCTMMSDLDEAWVEINMFSPVYAEYVARLLPSVWSRFSMDRDSLLWHERYESSCGRKGNEIFVRYSPHSLVGTREFIVNTNGDVITPKSMVMGRISNKYLAGNLLRQRALQVVRKLPDSGKFEFYLSELKREQNILQRYI